MNQDSDKSRTSNPKSHNQALPLAIFLMGPTATGKTELAVELTRRLPLEIVSVDSAMVYRGMDIGTAKPDVDTLKAAPHRLIGFLDPAEVYSAARFRADALREMADIVARGKIPLLVGGTMLYFRTLSEGLSALPGADNKVRARIDALAAREGWAVVHEHLRRIDPAAARRIHPNDSQRLQRALEVFDLTGRPMTELCLQSRSESLQYNIIRLALIPMNRSGLRARIARRFDGMLARGLIDEVAALRRRQDLNLDKPALRAVGYRQVWQYLDGTVDFTCMRVAAIAATCGLAKRQLTWLRSEREKVQVFAAESRPMMSVKNAIDSYLV